MSSSSLTSAYSQKPKADVRDHRPVAGHSFAEWLRYHVVLASLIVLVCSLGPRLFLTTRAEPKDLLRPDSYRYFTLALNLIEDGAFLDSHKEPEVARTPGYPVFVAAIMSVVGKDIMGQDLGKFVITQTIILSGSVVFLYWLARRILSPVMAFTGALFAAFSPWGAGLAGLPLTEGFFIFLLSLIFLVIKLVEDTSEVARAAWGSAAVGLLTAAAVLTRPAWPLVFLIGGSLFLRYGPKRKGAWLVLTVMILTAATPLFLWITRNVHEAHFYALTDVPGRGAWHYLASRVKSELTGVDRFEIQRVTFLDDDGWGLSVQEADQERWRRAKAVFREHPVLTLYCFLRSSVEHMVHPSPDVLTSARLNFHGDYWALGLLWGVFVVLACIGWQWNPDWDRDNGSIDRGYLFTLLVICLLLTLAGGMAFGAGSRYRVLLELIVPLLAGMGLVRVVRSFGSVRVPTNSTASRQEVIPSR